MKAREGRERVFQDSAHRVADGLIKTKNETRVTGKFEESGCHDIERIERRR